MRKWLVSLAILAVMMMTAACGSGEEVFTESTNAAAKDVKITATNWKFDQPVYHVKQGETFKLTFAVNEGAHGLKIEGMKGSMTGKQGDAPSKTYVANKPGEYLIVCSVACGSGHSQMRAKFIVD